MSDPVPQGSISLTEAYEAHFARKYGVQPSGRGLVWRQTETLDELVKAFASRDLEAVVRFPGSEENVRIRPDAWRSNPFPERPFIADEIAQTTEPLWQSFTGRTPFLEEAAFTQWSRNIIVERDRLRTLFDPRREPFWTLAMAVAWIVWRTDDQVRHYWESYRERAGDGACADSLIEMEVQEYSAGPEDQNEEKLLNIWQAKADLLKRLQDGSVAAIGIDNSSGQVVEIPAREWPYLKQTADNQFRDHFRREML